MVESVGREGEGACRRIYTTRTPFSDRVKEVDSPLDLQSIERSVVARGLSRCVIKTSRSDERLGFRV